MPLENVSGALRPIRTKTASLENVNKSPRLLGTKLIHSARSQKPQLKTSNSLNLSESANRIVDRSGIGSQTKNLIAVMKYRATVIREENKQMTVIVAAVLTSETDARTIETATAKGVNGPAIVRERTDTNAILLAVVVWDEAETETEADSGIGRIEAFAHGAEKGAFNAVSRAAETTNAATAEITGKRTTNRMAKVNEITGMHKAANRPETAV